MYCKIPRKHALFIILYFITILIIMLDYINLASFIIILRKIKYIYIVVVALLNISKLNQLHRKDKSWIIFSFLFLHTIVFGFICAKSIAIDAVHDHGQQMLIFLSFILVTYQYVHLNKIYVWFINTTFYALGIFFLLCVLQYPGDFVNPIWGMKQTFLGAPGSRYKTTFGFTHAGYLSNACFCAIAVSILFYEMNKRRYSKEKKIVIAEVITFDSVVLLMLISAAERSGILSVFILFGYYLVSNWVSKYKIPRFLYVFFMGLLCFAVIVFFVSGASTYVWENSSRSLNITVNYPVMQQIGDIWTGMGYVESGNFQREVSIFGIETSSLDMYYVYIFFTTGIVGCLMILSVLLCIWKGLIRIPKSTYKNAVLGMYYAMLFFAFWQVNLFTYRYFTSLILSTVLLISVDEGGTILEKYDWG